MRLPNFLSVLAPAALLALLLSACGDTSATTTGPGGADGPTLLEERCTVCHTLDRITSKQQTQDAWAQTVSRMVGGGARLNEAEQATLVSYLAATYGP